MQRSWQFACAAAEGCACSSHCGLCGTVCWRGLLTLPACFLAWLLCCFWLFCCSQALTDAGLAHLSFCPLLRLSLAGCPSVTVEGLRRLLLTCQSLQAVQLVGCTAVLPDQVEALQQAVRVVTGRRVELSWRSSKRGPGKQQHA